MKRVFSVTFIIFLLLAIEGHAQNYSILTGTVTQISWRWLVIKSNDGEVVQLRVGRRTVYPSRIPAVGDKVKVEYLIGCDPGKWKKGDRASEKGDRKPASVAFESFP
jgi:hypothetical protein